MDVTNARLRTLVQNFVRFERLKARVLWKVIKTVALWNLPSMRVSVLKPLSTCCRIASGLFYGAVYTSSPVPLSLPLDSPSLS